MGYDYTSTDNYKKIQQFPDIIKEDPNEIFFNFRNVGKGSFSYVYCAEDKTNNKFVALKKFKLSDETCDEDIKDIINEINIMKTINHENCVRYYGTFLTKDNKIYLSMEYCIGSVIDAITVLKTNLAENIILEILYSTIKALSYLHSLGYIHRDVKGANILINVDGVVKLSDFGSTSPNPLSSEFVGSSYWMAPELLLAMDNKDYNCLVDIWSFGITAIELVNKKPPHMEVHPMSAIYKVVQLPAPQIDAPEYSKNMNNLINSCLQKEIIKRPSASKLLEMINEFYTYPSLDRLAVYDLIMKTNKMIGLKMKDISTNVVNSAEPSSRNSEIFGDEENVDDITQELVELCNSREKGIKIKETPSNDIGKTITENHTLTNLIFTTTNNFMAIHLRELINAEDQNSSNEYHILQLEFMKKKNKEILKAISKLVHSQQVAVRNLEKKNNEVFEDMIVRMDSLLREKMNKCEQEMNKIKVAHSETLEKHIKNLSSTDHLKKRRLSHVEGARKLSVELKQLIYKENISIHIEAASNHTNSKGEVICDVDEQRIRSRQNIEREFLKEELDLLEKQLLNIHGFLIKSHTDLSSFQAKIMEEKQALRIKQINEKHVFEKVKYDQYKTDSTKTQDKCHETIVNNFPKKIKTGVNKLKREYLEYIKDYKIIQNSEYSKKNNMKTDENIKNFKKQHKMDTESHIKEYKNEMRTKIKNFKKDSMNYILTLVHSEKQNLQTDLLNHWVEINKCQQAHLEIIKEKMINRRLKLSDELFDRRKGLDEKMNADKKKFAEYSAYRASLLKQEHEKDFENLRNYLNISSRNSQV